MGEFPWGSCVPTLRTREVSGITRVPTVCKRVQFKKANV